MDPVPGLRAAFNLRNEASWHTVDVPSPSGDKSRRNVLEEVDPFYFAFRGNVRQPFWLDDVVSGLKVARRQLGESTSRRESKETVTARHPDSMPVVQVNRENPIPRSM